MRPLRLLLVYLAAVFLGGAILAPWLYFAFHPVLPRQPFHRFLDRSLLGLALVGLWPLLRSLGMKSWRELGLVNLKSRGPDFAIGIFIGSLTILAALAVTMIAGVRLPQFHFDKLANATVAAAIVSFLEELLFRGALFGLLRRTFDWRLAALLSSLIYAAGHFLHKADLAGQITWLSGLQLLPAMFQDFTVARFINLTLVGCSLAVAYQRTGALYCSMALHGAWIFWIQTLASDNMLDGWNMTPLLAGAILLVIGWAPAKSNA